MKTISKLLLVAVGFILSIAAASNYAKANNISGSVLNRECHGSGTCFVTDGGTTINGQWTESAE